MNEKLKFFVLEDDPNRVEGFRAALHGHEATYAIDVEAAKRDFVPPYDVLLLDHDLGGEVFVDSEDDNTGAGFVRWLVETHGRLAGTCAVFVHSWNPAGANRMANLLNDGGWESVKFPFSGELLRALPKITRATESPEHPSHD